MSEKQMEAEGHRNVDENTPFKKDQEDINEPSKIKFFNGGAKGDNKGKQDEVEIEMPNGKKGGDEFCGLTKEELLKYADDPFWVKVRWILLILFWVVWIGMLVSAILIIVFAPKCPPRPKLDWWQKSSVYQVYPRSFKDSDADGHGDLLGIHGKLDYLLKINATTIWLNSIFSSSDYNIGFDVTDFTAIQSDFGTMDDFNDLRIAAHKKGIRVILDFIPNYTSMNHSWFEQSRMGGDDNEYKDFYVWHAGNGRDQPPNNWKNRYGDSAWTFDETRQEFYYHHLAKEQPDLNMRHPAVVTALKDAMQFWLDHKVDGFVVRDAPYLYESQSLADQSADEQNLTSFLGESYELITELRSLLDKHSKQEGRNHPRVLFIDAHGSKEQLGGFYKYKGEKGAHMILNSDLVTDDVNADCHAQCLSNLIQMSQKRTDDADAWENFRTGSLESSRVGSRVGKDMVSAMNMMLLTLPGTSVSYYGEEIGMTDVDVTYEQTRDYRAKQAGQASYMDISRDPQRSPMQWDSGALAGFTSGDSAWLPVADDFEKINVKAQEAHGSGLTNLAVFRHLTALRSEPSMQWGTLTDLTRDDDMLVYVRSAEGFDTFLVAINVGVAGDRAVDLRLDDRVPARGFIVASTQNFQPHARASAFELGTQVPLDNINLASGEGIVVGWHDVTDDALAME